VLLAQLAEQQIRHERNVERILQQHIERVDGYLKQTRCVSKVSTEPDVGTATLLVETQKSSQRVSTSQDGVGQSKVDVHPNPEAPSSWSQGPLGIDKLTRLASQMVEKRVEQSEMARPPEGGGRIQRYCRTIARCRAFDISTTCFIIVNAIVQGFQIDWKAQHVGDTYPLAYRLIDAAFAAAFLGEFLIRLIDQGMYFFSMHNPQAKWNAFDAGCVLSGILDEAFRVMLDSLPQVPTLTVLRLLRLVRVLRVVRAMRSFRDLRIIVAGILASAKPLFWCGLILLLQIFILSMVIMTVVTGKAEMDYRYGRAADANMVTSQLYFGSMSRSMYTCYAMISGGLDWTDVADPVAAISAPMALMFTVYIGFSVLCVFSVVTALFVDKAHQFSKSDVDSLVVEELATREKWVNELRKLFTMRGMSGTQKLTGEEFKNCIEDVCVQAYLRSIGLNVEQDNAMALFSLIDLEGSGSLGLSEFVEGCSQFVGNARQLDIARLRYDTSKVLAQVIELKESLQAADKQHWHRG